MSIECNNTTPLGSRTGDELLNATSSDLLNAIIDLSSLLPTDDNDPITGSNLDRKKVIDTTNALNNVLANTPLDGLPSLEDKLGENGGVLTPSDLAEFAIDTNANLDEIKEAIDKYNGNLPDSDITNEASGGDTTTTDISGLVGIENTTSGAATGGVETGLNTGSGTSRVLGGDSSLISKKNLTAASQLAALRAAGTRLSRNEILAVVGGRQALMPVILNNLLQDLDFQYATNLGQKLTSSVCGAYNDVLSDLTKAFAVVNSGKATIDQITNLLEKDVKKLAESIKQRGVLDTLMSLLQQVIEGVIKAAKGLAIAAVGSVVAVLKGMESAASAIMKKLNKTLKNINDYMQDASVQKIIADMEKVLATLASSFERLTPENIANLMFRLCQMARDLQTKLMAPSKKLNKLANSVSAEAIALKSQNALNVQSAVKYGALRVSESDRLAKQKAAFGKYAKVSPKKQEQDFVTRDTPSEEEIAIINGVSDSGLGSNIKFSSAVVEAEGWKEINDNVWARLLRVVNQTGETYEVKQGFVARKDKEALGGAKLNSHNSGYAIDIVTTEKNREDTIVAASRAGFTGIGVYNGHLHLDLANRRGWQKGYSGQKFNDIQALLDKHTIDGFKKKRS